MMTRHIAALGIGFLLASAGLASAGDAAKGKELYATNKCSMCHSLEGKGNKKSPLDGVGTKLSADDLRKWLVTPKDMEAKLATKPKISMKSYASLPKDDLDSLVAYLQTLKK
jgi:mono/diheme cytochrome c family protein